MISDIDGMPQPYGRGKDSLVVAESSPDCERRKIARPCLDKRANRHAFSSASE
jgi:hypothetical protein